MIRQVLAPMSVCPSAFCFTQHPPSVKLVPIVRLWGYCFLPSLGAIPEWWALSTNQCLTNPSDADDLIITLTVVEVPKLPSLNTHLLGMPAKCGAGKEMK